MDRKLAEKIKTYINFKYSADEICLALNISVEKLLRYLKLLKIDKNLKERFIIENALFPAISFNIPEDISKVCFISDTHYCSVKDRPDVIELIYNFCDNEGIRYVFCAGDFTSGLYSEDESHKNQNRVTGVDNMIDYVVNTHPYKKGIEFYTISGNHDASFLRTVGINVCEKIAKQRKDITYLGHDKADVRFDNLSIFLWHGKNYKDNFNRYQHHYKHVPLLTKPDIMALGHIHHSGYQKINDTHILQISTTMDTPDFLLAKNITTTKGFWIANIQNLDDDKIISPDLYEVSDNLGISRVRIKGNYYNGK